MVQHSYLRPDLIHSRESPTIIKNDENYIREEMGKLGNVIIGKDMVVMLEILRSPPQLEALDVSVTY